MAKPAYKDGFCHSAKKVQAADRA